LYVAAGEGGLAPREQTYTGSIAKSSFAVVQSQFHDGEDYFIATFTAYAAAPLAVIYYYGARAGAAQSTLACKLPEILPAAHTATAQCMLCVL
jgi:hypothetical protein